MLSLSPQGNKLFSLWEISGKMRDIQLNPLGGTMPEFAIVPMREAQASTIAGRQGRFIQEYIRYIRQISQGQAGKLHLGEHENPVTIRRRLVQAAQAIDIQLIIKRSGQDVYFWSEDSGEEQPRRKRSYTRRRRPEEEMIVPEQPFTEPEEFEQAVSEQTTVSDAV
jgi:hypothetical protein